MGSVSKSSCSRLLHAVGVRLPTAPWLATLGGPAALHWRLGPWLGTQALLSRLLPQLRAQHRPGFAEGLVLSQPGPAALCTPCPPPSSSPPSEQSKPRRVCSFILSQDNSGISLLGPSGLWRSLCVWQYHCTSWSFIHSASMDWVAIVCQAGL